MTGGLFNPKSQGSSCLAKTLFLIPRPCEFRPSTSASSLYSKPVFVSSLKLLTWARFRNQNDASVPQQVLDHVFVIYQTFCGIPLFSGKVRRVSLRCCCRRHCSGRVQSSLCQEPVERLVLRPSLHAYKRGGEPRWITGDDGQLVRTTKIFRVSSVQIETSGL